MPRIILTTALSGIKFAPSLGGFAGRVRRPARRRPIWRKRLECLFVPNATCIGSIPSHVLFAVERVEAGGGESASWRRNAWCVCVCVSNDSGGTLGRVLHVSMGLKRSDGRLLSPVLANTLGTSRASARLRIPTLQAHTQQPCATVHMWENSAQLRRLV